MSAGDDRPVAAMTEGSDGVPRTDVDLEAELEALRDFVVRGPSLLNHRLWLELEDIENRFEQVIALLPKEIRRARRVTREEQRIIQDAKDEARRVLEEARAESDHLLTSARSEVEQIVTASREEADRLVEQSSIRQKALEQAEATIARAEEAAREVRERSYTYAQEVITNVEVSLKRLTHSVEQDKAQLDEMRPD